MSEWEDMYIRSEMHIESIYLLIDARDGISSLLFMQEFFVDLGLSERKI